MFPTSNLPVSPLVASTGMGTLVGALAGGAFVVLVVGWLLYQREQRKRTAIVVTEPVSDDATGERRGRLSA